MLNNNSLTYDDRDLHVGLWEGIRAGPLPWPDDDQGAVDTCLEAGDMSMPPQGAFLPDDVEPVGEVVTWLDGALRDHWHPISPTVQPLLHSMPTPEDMKIRKDPEKNSLFRMQQETNFIFSFIGQCKMTQLSFSFPDTLENCVSSFQQ
jgi:hypothetical protein